MPFPPAKLRAAQAVLRTPEPLHPDRHRDDLFAEAVAAEFPRIVNHQPSFDGAPPQYPHMVLGSTSSQLAVSLAQAEFNVGFYDALADEPQLALDYVARKLKAIFAGFEAIGQSPSMVGVIGTLQFSTMESGTDPVAHILQTHLRSELAPEDVQDAEAKLAVRLRDTYFATLTVKNYELKQIRRPVTPMMGPITIRPWEGTVSDRGLEVIVDINNNLEGHRLRADPAVTMTGIDEVIRILTATLETAGPMFAERGVVQVSELAGVQA